MFVKDMLKYIFFRGQKIIYRVICIFPIKRNRIVCMSHRGASQYSDSPMYITEYILKNYPGEFEIIWEVNDLEKFSFLAEKGIKIIKFGSFMDYYYLNTAKVSITNSGFPSFMIKRKNQLRINTWHAGMSYKSGAVYGRKISTEATFFARRLKKYIKNQYNLMLSSCEVMSKERTEGAFQYKGEMLNCGLPRNDIMFQNNESIIARIKEYYSIGYDKKILLVAPTWKQNNDDRNIQIDYKEICDLLEEKTKSKWVVLLRLHHLSVVNIEHIIREANGNVINATDYPNVQELLFAADMLITDYSSVIWDFALTGKPIVIFVPDNDEYKKVRGTFMPVKDWGLSYATNRAELLAVIKHSTIHELENNSKQHILKLHSYENGNATETVVKRIVEFCKK